QFTKEILDVYPLRMAIDGILNKAKERNKSVYVQQDADPVSNAMKKEFGLLLFGTAICGRTMNKITTVVGAETKQKKKSKKLLETTLSNTTMTLSWSVSARH